MFTFTANAEELITRSPNPAGDRDFLLMSVWQQRANDDDEEEAN